MKKALLPAAIFTILSLSAFAWQESAEETAVHEKSRPRLSIPGPGRIFSSVGSDRPEKQILEESVEAQQQTSSPLSSSECIYLKEIASLLMIPVSENDTPGDIAWKIQSKLGQSTQYPGEILSDGSFEKAKWAIRIPADAETFEDYHTFIKKVAGKKILILEADE